MKQRGKACSRDLCACVQPPGFYVLSCTSHWRLRGAAAHADVFLLGSAQVDAWNRCQLHMPPLKPDENVCL